tara:strand:- start:106 stop:504 length:399 start_codon:yes stop_codon:yes gene_type:complete
MGNFNKKFNARNPLKYGGSAGSDATYSSATQSPLGYSPLKQVEEDSEADRIFGQELQLNEDGKTYNARGQDYQVAGVTDIIVDPKGILKKYTDEEGYVMDMDFSFETKGDTTFITGIKEDAAHTPKPPKPGK